MKLPQDTIFHYRSEDGIKIMVDAIPLVRCKECKYWNSFQIGEHGLCYEWGCVGTKADGYCYKGEKNDAE